MYKKRTSWLYATRISFAFFLLSSCTLILLGLPSAVAPYKSAVWVDQLISIQDIAIADGLKVSNEASATYTIGSISDEPPIADAGPDIMAKVGTVVTLNGAHSSDSDGNTLEISEEWEQILGPAATILDADETVANFTPTEIGEYTFRLIVSDVNGAVDTDEVMVNIEEDIPDVLDNLIARWTMEEGSGLTIKDYSDYAHVGRVEGAIWTHETIDSSQYSLKFDGVDDRVAIGNIDLTGESMTITFWYKADDFDISDARFISKADGQFDQDHLWMLSALNDSRLRFRLKTDGKTTTLISPLGTLGVDEWIHIAAVYDGKLMRLFKNGEEVARAHKSGKIDSDPTVPAAIGNQPAEISGGTRPFDGSLDEMRIYGRALSEAEILIVKDAKPVQLAEPAPEPIPVNEAPDISWISPKANSVFQEGEDVTLIVNAKDLDGEVKKVSFYENGQLVAEVLEEPFRYQWEDIAPGIYDWRAYVYDDFDAVDSTDILTLLVEEKEVVEGDTISLPPTPTIPSEDIDPIVWYTFEEGEGDIVYDKSEAGDPIDLYIPNQQSIQWVTGGLVLKKPTLLTSQTLPEKLYNAYRESQEITLEAWVLPADKVQGGPARILTFSQDPYSRNFTLGQSGNAYSVRLRTSETDNNGRPDINSSKNMVDRSLTHIVFTRNRVGQAAIYINGVLDKQLNRPGDFSNWSSNFRLGIGNELNFGRPWLGILYEVAIYPSALSVEKIWENFEARRYQELVPTDNPFNISEIAAFNRLHIYPNPATSTVNIEPSENDDILQISLTDMRGRSTSVSFYQKEGVWLTDVESLSSGIYFLHIQTKATLVRRKILVGRN